MHGDEYLADSGECDGEGVEHLRIIVTILIVIIGKRFVIEDPDHLTRRIEIE